MAAFRPKEVFRQAREAEASGKIKEAAGHYASLSVYLRRRGRLEESLLLMRRAVALAPHLPRLHLQLAICAETNSDFVAADAALATFVDKVIQKGRAQEMRSYMESALKEFPRLREKYFERVLQLDRTEATAFLGRSQSLAEQGDGQGAFKVLVDALETGHDQDRVIEALQSFLTANGKAEALGHLQRFRTGKLSKQDCLILLRKDFRAEPSLREATATAEKPLKDLIEDLEHQMGLDVADPQQEIAPLLAEFRRRSDPILGQDAQARIDMALAYFEMGLFRESQQELEHVSDSDPLFAEAQVFLAEVCLAQGSDLAAMEALQKSLRTPGKAEEVERESRYKLIRVYLRLGDLGNAFDQLTELESVAPDYRDLRQLKNQILESMEKNHAAAKAS